MDFQGNQNVVEPGPFPASAANVIHIVPASASSFRVSKEFVR